MKKKILIFIGGMLVGGVITTVGFLVFGKVNKMPQDRFPINQNGEFVAPENMGEMPEFPKGGFEGETPQTTNTVN